jgi:hypothetical protein
MIGIKIDPKMKEALEKVAQSKFMSMSGYIKAACEKALLEDGIDWKTIPESRPPAKKKS